jgi:hypothetical protein
MERRGESDYQGDFRRVDNGDWKMTRRLSGEWEVPVTRNASK